MDRIQRQILLNQYDILKLLDPKQAAQYDLSRAIISGGYTTRYEQSHNSVSEDEMPEAIQREVYNVLDMFRSLDAARRRGWIPSNIAASEYSGFDANNDPHHWFAGHILDVEGLYSESAPNKNSHSMGTIQQYRRMLAIWDTAAVKHGLTTAEAEAIITA